MKNESGEETERSYYALDISTLKEIEEGPTEGVRVLRIMHCTQLTSLEGAGDFRQLVELNCASNQLTEIGHIFHLTSLLKLNLSCNNISAVPDLSGLSALEELVLSHNRISNIEGFSHVLRCLDGLDARTQVAPSQP
jgi:Leucine-rich repeat (LRR) protein